LEYLEKTKEVGYMKLAIMQPYFFPYIGYFQLLNSVEEFILYDNIEFTKKGWINRNRVLVNGKDSYITLPLKKGSDYLEIKDRYLSDTWYADRIKMLNKIRESYRKAPNFNFVFPLIEGIIFFEGNNLFNFIFNSLNKITEYLEIKTSFVVSSTIQIDHKLKADKKVIQICKTRGANVYINPIGGVELYNKDDFKSKGIDLYFLKTNDIKYEQFNNDFIPYLSIIDVMMFNTNEKIKEYLNSAYALV
jgi:hypothetical protein